MGRSRSTSQILCTAMIEESTQIPLISEPFRQGVGFTFAFSVLFEKRKRCTNYFVHARLENIEFHEGMKTPFLTVFPERNTKSTGSTKGAVTKSLTSIVEVSTIIRFLSWFDVFCLCY